MATKKQKEKKFRKELLSEMIRLATSAFGLVAAFAWNDFIKQTFALYLQPAIGEGGTIISQAVYALIVTFLAVGFTYNLARLRDKI